MRKFKLQFVLPLLLSMFAFSSQLQAGLITGVTPGVGFGPAGNGDFTIAPVIVTGAEGTGDHLGGPNPNHVDLHLDVFAMNAPFELNFSIDSGAVSFPNETDYAFSLFVTNSLNANGVDPANAMKEINGFDIELIPSAGAIVAFDIATPRAGSVPFAGPPGIPLAFETPNLPAGGIRFGGLNGGGGGIPFGATHILNFSIDVIEFFAEAPPGAGFTLRFTANPEPEAIALGLFALAVGGFFVYRRRNQKLAIQTEAAAQAA